VPYIERPVFVSWIALLAQLPVQIFFTFWAGVFFGGIANAVLGFRGNEPMWAIGLAAFVLVPCVAYVGKKLNYARTEYKFYDDHLEFEEGFFSQNRKAVHYADVREVTLKKGILQRTCNLGTIYLGTLATGSAPSSNPFYALGFGNVSASGVGIRDVHDPDAAYARIRALVDAAKA